MSPTPSNTALPSPDDIILPDLPDDQELPPTSTALPRLLSARDVGAIFGRGERSLRRWVRSGHLPAIRIGGALFFHPDDVSALLSSRVSGTPRPDLGKFNCSNSAICRRAMRNEECLVVQSIEGSS